MVAPECAPAAKAGGLGDVVSGLSRELELRGHAVEIILPKYASMRYPDIWDLQPSYRDLWVPWYGERVNCTVWFGYASGRKCFFIEPHSAANFFGRDRLYGYWDDAERFAFFAKAAVEFMFRANKRPDIVHCHDWQTGLVPVLLHEQYAGVMPGQKICYTIHNFRHQGTSDERVLWATQLGRPDHFLDADRLGDDFRYPSMFEPCGLAPLIGMRYGTVPVVRATGGMIDTVFDRDHSGRTPAERNGYVFHHTDNRAIESALSRALRLWFARPREFRHLAAGSMQADYSWRRPGQDYLAIYGHLQHR